MTTREIADALNELGITTGYAIRNGQIVTWQNDTEIPESLAAYVALDVTD